MILHLTLFCCFFNILRQQLNCTKNKEHEVASNISGQNKAVKRQ